MSSVEDNAADTRYTLSAEGIRYVTHRDRAQLPTTQGIWSTALTTDRQGRRRHVGHRIDTWARQTKHADGITWFLSKLEAEARDRPRQRAAVVRPHRQVRPGLQLGRFGHRTRRRGADDSPSGLHDTVLPSSTSYAPVTPGESLPAWTPMRATTGPHEHKEDQPPYPTTLFVVDTEEVEDTYVRTAARMSRMSLPIFVSCRAVLSHTGILGPSWHPLWEPESPRLPLSALRAYQWDSLYHRMRHRPVGG